MQKQLFSENKNNEKTTRNFEWRLQEWSGFIKIN